MPGSVSQSGRDLQAVPAFQRKFLKLRVGVGVDGRSGREITKDENSGKAGKGRAYEAGHVDALDEGDVGPVLQQHPRIVRQLGRNLERAGERRAGLVVHDRR